MKAGTVRCRRFDGPLSVAAITDVVDLQAGPDHICARDRGGQMACWGRSLVDPGVDEPSPEQPLWLDLPGPALEFGIGYDYGCARLEDDRVYCWGEDTYGQRGRLSPQFLTRPTSFVLPPITPSTAATPR